MVKMGRPDGIDTTSLCDVFIAGGPASVEQVNALRDIMPGSNVSLAYGMTESTGFMTTFRENVRRDMLLAYKNPSSSGVPIAGIKYKVLTIILFVLVIRKPTPVSNKSISKVVSLFLVSFMTRLVHMKLMILFLILLLILLLIQFICIVFLHHICIYIVLLIHNITSESFVWNQNAKKVLKSSESLTITACQYYTTQ